MNKARMKNLDVSFSNTCRTCMRSLFLPSEAELWLYVVTKTLYGICAIQFLALWHITSPVVIVTDAVNQQNHNWSRCMVWSQSRPAHEAGMIFLRLCSVVTLKLFSLENILRFINSFLVIVDVCLPVTRWVQHCDALRGKWNLAIWETLLKFPLFVSGISQA